MNFRDKFKNINNFKTKNRECLFNKLKNWGCSFEHINYVNDRCMKIAFILNEGLVGWSQSPILKNNKRINLIIYVEKIELVVNDKVLNTIKDWYYDLNKTFRLISNYYESQFYYTEEVLDSYRNRKDVHELEKAIESLYPTIRIRHVNTTDYFSVWAGAGQFTFLLEKKNDSKKIEITTYYYSRGNSEYQKNRWDINNKYVKIIKSLNFKPVYNYDLKKLLRIYEKCKKIN